MKLLLFAYFVLSLASCASISEKNQEKSNLHMQLGLSYLEKNNLPLALREMLNAIEANPRNSLAHNNLGLIYFLREKYDLSATHFQKAFEITPSFTDAKNNLARVSIEQKDYEKADQLLNDVFNDLTYPDLAKANLNKGLLEFNKRNFTAATPYFLKVLEFEPQNCFGQIYLGRSYLELEKYQAALKQLENGSSICKINGIDEAHYYSAIVLFRMNRKSESVLRFKETIKQFPNGKYKLRSLKMIELIEKGAS